MKSNRDSYLRENLPDLVPVRLLIALGDEGVRLQPDVVQFGAKGQGLQRGDIGDPVVREIDEAELGQVGQAI